MHGYWAARTRVHSCQTLLKHISLCTPMPATTGCIAQPSALPLDRVRYRIDAQKSASPPHAVIVDAVTDSVLLALDPESALEESTQRDAQQADAAPEEAAEAEQDPRSLQDAVEALAKFTSESVAG